MQPLHTSCSIHLVCRNSLLSSGLFLANALAIITIAIIEASVTLGISVSFSAKSTDDRSAIKQLTDLFGALHHLREADRRGEGVRFQPSSTTDFNSVSHCIVSISKGFMCPSNKIDLVLRLTMLSNHFETYWIAHPRFEMQLGNISSSMQSTRCQGSCFEADCDHASLLQVL